MYSRVEQDYGYQYDRGALHRQQHGSRPLADRAVDHSQMFEEALPGRRSGERVFRAVGDTSRVCVVAPADAQPLFEL